MFLRSFGPLVIGGSCLSEAFPQIYWGNASATMLSQGHGMGGCQTYTCAIVNIKDSRGILRRGTGRYKSVTMAPVIRIHVPFGLAE